MRKRPLPKFKKPNVSMRKQIKIRRYYNDMFDLYPINTGLATDEQQN
jgi:hypothetical protein